jgi:hypothetical protein
MSAPPLPISFAGPVVFFVEWVAFFVRSVCAVVWSALDWLEPQTAQARATASRQYARNPHFMV